MPLTSIEKGCHFNILVHLIVGDQNRDSIAVSLYLSKFGYKLTSSNNTFKTQLIQALFLLFIAA